MIVTHEATKTKTEAITGGLSRSSMLARQLRGRLGNSGYPVLRDISCHVHDGVAFLDGRLRTHYLKQLAQTVAIEMEGIVRVENRIEVVAHKSVADHPGFVGPN
ncbi:BON domain-containing protein [Tundrisphaera lichenicola]|uniref:BON domain-containing protein n=1 Tax=Tundrisphaera lichenicola TaxID=2029860 RepID=UPI003EBAD42E